MIKHILIISIISSIAFGQDYKQITEPNAGHIIDFDVAENGFITVLAGSGKVSTYDKNGILVWNQKLESEAYTRANQKSVVCLKNGTFLILCGSNSDARGRIFLLNSEGAILWSFGSTVENCLISPDQNGIIGKDKDGAFYLNIQGNLVWRNIFISGRETDFCFFRDLVAVSDGLSKSSVLSIFDGKLNWSLENTQSPVPYAVNFGNSEIIIASDFEVALYDYSGRCKWKIALDVNVKRYSFQLMSRPIVTSRNYILVPMDGHLGLLSSAGKWVQIIPIKGTYLSCVAIDSEGKIYVISDKHVYPVDSSGAVGRSLFDRVEVRRVVISQPNGKLFALGEDGCIYFEDKRGG